MPVHGLEVARGAVFICAHDHSMAPRHGGAYGYLLEYMAKLGCPYVLPAVGEELAAVYLSAHLRQHEESGSHTPIPVPLHWQEEVKAGLDRDVNLGVHVQWASIRIGRLFCKTVLSRTSVT